MGDRELLYVVLGTLFFMSLTVAINKYFVNNGDEFIQKEYEYQAVSLAQRVLEEVKTRDFDANSTESALSSVTYDSSNVPSIFENPNNMSHGSGEDYPHYNDVDDFGAGFGSSFNYGVFRARYNLYLANQDISYLDGGWWDTHTVSTDRGDFDVSFLSFYVDDADLRYPVVSRTYYKKVIVKVENDYMDNTVVLEHVYSFLNVY